MALNLNDTKFLDIAEIICEEGLSEIGILKPNDMKQPLSVWVMPMGLNLNN